MFFYYNIVPGLNFSEFNQMYEILGSPLSDPIKIFRSSANTEIPHTHIHTPCLIYHRPSGENSSFCFALPCLMMGEVSLETSPRNIMIQEIINLENSEFIDVLTDFELFYTKF